MPPAPVPVDPATARVTFLAKPGCHLCDDARRVLARVAADLGVRWVEVDVLDHPDLLERYGEQIPVTFVDGRQHDYWRLDEARLRAALAVAPG
jgi:glutaredoxin